MGLTIHWSFHLPAGAKDAAPPEHDDSLMLFELPPVEPEVPVASAEDALSALRSAALDLGFAGVSEMYRISGEPERGTIAAWVWSGAQRTIYVAGERVEVAPVEVFGFDVEPGEGCETACFWLARYPATAWVPGVRSRRVRTELAGWYSDDFCKTQYASNHGMENFLRSHVSLVRILDLARTMGFLTQVHDEGRYWTKRDQSDLANECEDWNRCLAAFFGGLRDMMGEGGEAPIFAHPRFEMIEAEGLHGEVATTLDALGGGVGTCGSATVAATAR